MQRQIDSLRGETTQERRKLWFKAIQSGSVEAVRQGVDVHLMPVDSIADNNEASCQGFTGLMCAVYHEQLGVAAVNRAHECACRFNGYTPLMAAARLSRMKNVRLLVARGADVNARQAQAHFGEVDNTGLTAFHWAAIRLAAFYKRSDNLKLLIKNRVALPVNEAHLNAIRDFVNGSSDAELKKLFVLAMADGELKRATFPSNIVEGAVAEEEKLILSGIPVLPYALKHLVMSRTIEWNPPVTKESWTESTSSGERKFSPVVQK